MQRKKTPYTNAMGRIGENLARIHARIDRIAATASAFKPSPAQLPVDLDREVARLKKANKNLRIKLRWHEEELLRNAKMPLATFRAIAKCLHPDHKPSEAEREHACKLFNVFWASRNER